MNVLKERRKRRSERNSGESIGSGSYNGSHHTNDVNSLSIIIYNMSK